MSKLLAICLAAFVAVAAATSGVDVSSATSSSSFSCLKSQGYDFAIVRGFESVNQPVPSKSRVEASPLFPFVLRSLLVGCALGP